MRPKTARLGLLFVQAVMCISCSSSSELRNSTLESSAAQLRAAARSGYPTQIVFVDERIDASEAVARAEITDRSKTHLVLTLTDAQIVWAEDLKDRPPMQGRAIVGNWVLPHLKKEDLDGALKAFVFGYLEALHGSGLIEWNEAIVPFLPPGSAPRRNHAGGLLLAFFVALIVAKSARHLD